MPRPPGMRAVLHATLLLAAVVTVHSQAELSAPVGYAPLYVSLVKLRDLPPYPGTTDFGSAAQARAQGFPAAFHFSHAPITRSTEVSSLGAALSAPAPDNNSIFQTRAADLPLAPPPSSSSSSTAKQQQASDASLSLAFTGGVAAAGFGDMAAPSFGRRLEASPSSSSSTRSNSSVPLPKTSSSSSSSSTGRAGFNSIDSARGTQGIAVGPTQLLHAAGQLLAVYTLDPATGSKSPSSPPQQVLLSSLFASAADGCTGGVYDPDLVYDKLSSRFLVSATCGGDGRVLLAVSTSSDAAGSWFVYGLVADGVGTSLACTAPQKESALVDYTKLTYNHDGVYISYYSYCPSNPSMAGAGLLALPKFAAVKGMPNFFYAVYSSGEVVKALGAAAAAEGLGPASCRQLQPVVPQTVRDIPAGSATFMCEVLSPNPAIRRIAVVSLADTGTLWQYGGPDSSTSSPLLAAQLLQLKGQAPAAELKLNQPSGGAGLAAGGTSPSGFWSGKIIRFKSRVYVALRGDTAPTSSSGPRPGVLWAQLTVNTTASGSNLCPASQYGASAAKSFEWSKDYTVNWGKEWDSDWDKQPRSLQQIAGGAAGSGGGMGVASVAAAVGMGVSDSGAVIQPNRAKVTMRVSGMDLGSGCTCYDCYWQGSYYLWGGYTAGTDNLPGLYSGGFQGNGLYGGVNLQGFGYAGYGFLAGYYSFGTGYSGWNFNGAGSGQCYTKCMYCWYYGYPGYGFGYSPQGVQIGGWGEAKPADISGGGAASVMAADFNRLLRPCNRTAAVAATVAKQGLVAGSGTTMGAAFPVVYASPNNTLALVYAFSGPGRAGSTAGSDATTLPGMAMTALPLKPNANSTQAFVVIKKGRAPIPSWALGPGASWGDASAIDVHPSSGRVYAVVRYAAASSPEAPVGTWVGVWSPDQLDKLVTANS